MTPHLTGEEWAGVPSGMEELLAPPHKHVCTGRLSRAVLSWRGRGGHGSREVRAVSEWVACDEPSPSCGFWQVSSPLFNSKSMSDLSQERDWESRLSVVGCVFVGVFVHTLTYLYSESKPGHEEGALLVTASLSRKAGWPPSGH